MADLDIKVKHYETYLKLGYAPEIAANKAGLNEFELAQLQGLGGDAGKPEDGFTSNNKYNKGQAFAEAQNSPEEKTVGQKILNGVGAVISICLGGLFASCSENTISQQVQLSFSLKEFIGDATEIKALLKELINAQKEGNQEVADLKTDLDYIKKQMATLIKNQEYINEMIEAGLGDNYKVLNDILSAIESIDVTNAQGLDLLTKMYAKIIEMTNLGQNINQNMQDGFNNVMTLLTKLGADGSKLLNQIVDLIVKGNSENSKYLKWILDTINKFASESGEDRSRIIALLETMSGKIDENTTAIKGMDEKTQANFDVVIKLLGLLGAQGADILNAVIENGKISQEQAQQIISLQQGTNIALVGNNALLFNILNEIAKLDANDQKSIDLLNKILAKVTNIDNTTGKIDADMQTGFNTVIELINKLGDNGATVLDKVVELIAQGNEISGKILNILQNMKPGDEENVIALLNKILAQMEKSEANDQARYEGLVDVITYYGEKGINLSNKVITLLEKGNKIGENNNVVLNMILERLQHINPSGDEDILAMLEKILAQVEANVNATKDMDAKTQANFAVVIELLGKLGSDGDKILQAIVEHGEMTEQEFESLKALVEENNKIGKNNGILLVQILNAIQSINPGENEDILKVLNQILAKVTEQIKTTKDMDAKTQTNFAVVIELLGKLGSDGDKILQAIVEHGEMTEQEFESLKALVIKNNELTAKTNEWMVKLDANQKEIIEKLKNFEPSGEVTDLTEITNLLKQINDGVIKNGDTQTQILEKIEVLSLAVNQLVNVVGDNNKAILLQILNKIPHACECKPVDISEVIEILIEIKQEIKSGNHEGILEDLDEYFS